MDNEKPIISVITPVYKTGTVLFESWENMRAQAARMPALEWILVNDGSDDEATLDALSKIETEAAFYVKVFHLSNGGACRARNYGLSQARGGYVKFLDADDLQEPGLLEIQARLARQHAGSIIAAPEKQVVVEPDGRIEVLIENRLDVLPDDLFAATLERGVFHHCALLIPRALVEAIGGYDESLEADQDGDFMLRLFWRRPRVEYSDKAAFLFRQHNLTVRISSSQSPAKIASRYSVYAKVRAMLEDAQALERYRRELAVKLLRVAWKAADVDVALAARYVCDARALYPALRLHPRGWINRLIRLVGFKSTYRLIRLVRR